MAVTDSLIEIGYISGTHGIKGEIKLMLNQFIICENDFSDSYLFIDKGNGVTMPIKVTRVYEKNSNLIIKSNELNSINEAQTFVKKKCFVKQIDFEECFSELVDYRQYTVLEGEKNLGLVVDIMDNGIYELFKVNIGSRMVWVPNVERYVKEINDDNKTITIVDGEALG